VDSTHRSLVEVIDLIVDLADGLTPGDRHIS
jgi:hypothetical protein